MVLVHVYACLGRHCERCWWMWALVVAILWGGVLVLAWATLKSGSLSGAVIGLGIVVAHIFRLIPTPLGVAGATGMSASRLAFVFVLLAVSLSVVAALVKVGVVAKVSAWLR